MHADCIAGAVVQLGGPRRLQGRNLLGMLKGTTILEVSGDAGAPKGTISGRLGQFG